MDKKRVFFTFEVPENSKGVTWNLEILLYIDFKINNPRMRRLKICWRGHKTGLRIFGNLWFFGTDFFQLFRASFQQLKFSNFSILQNSDFQLNNKFAQKHYHTRSCKIINNCKFVTKHFTFFSMSFRSKKSVSALPLSHSSIFRSLR